jgi:ABC-type polar amino acid transport system ATPase subunit
MPATTYQQYLQTHTATLQTLQKTKTRLAWLRFITVIATAIDAYKGFEADILFGVIAMIIGISIFLFFIAKDVANNKAINHTNTLIDINHQELAVLNYQYFHRESGDQFAQPTHAYANDLDIFGKASLYQYINRCNTEQGKALLADNLQKAITKEAIQNRQSAIAELKQKTQWQQQLQAFGLQSPITIGTEQKINQWLQNDEQHLQPNYWKMLLPLYGIFTTACVVLYTIDFLSTPIFSGILILCLVFAFAQSKKVMVSYTLLNGIVKELSVAEQLITTIEQSNFEVTALKSLQSQLNIDNIKASKAINALKQILNRFDVRLNVYLFLALNTLFLWDVWQIRALNKWKATYKQHVKTWFEVIAEMEVINTLAILGFNHPNWCVPTIADSHFIFSASKLGHPLIGDNKCVTNNFTSTGAANITLITGSNMAGKSTFLRSIGCNTVLALMGSVVCAESFNTSHIRLMSSMRIADNLAENTSTFYAELKKLQSIIEAVNQHEKLFILLDEILRGTNSLDRHTGSKALIKQLIKLEAVAILATHDVELAKEVNNHPQNITNYHFDVQVANDELYFDYKLKDGICKSLNASILMRKIGIDMEV